jgi:succinoglycan biosynthesis protein ExoM
MSNQKIIINICTYKRPQMLTACIDSILSQKVPNTWEVEILIVDNDATQSAETIIHAYSQSNVMPMTYFCEKNQGIPYARNRGYFESLQKNADWILFIDDDETADENWLLAYHEATKKYAGDVYSGPVRYAFPQDYADWLGNKGDSETPDGAHKRRASTNNALVHRKVFEASGYNLKFDVDMTFTGGSDTDFFIRYEKMGGKIIHVSQAVVAEEVIANRLSIAWRLSRQYRSSTNRVYVNKKIMGVKKATLLAIKETLRHLIDGLLGLIFCPLSLLKGKNSFKRKYYHAMRHLAKSTGSFTGIFGMQPQPYKNPDGY